MAPQIRTMLMRIVRRPLKIVKNFLKLQIIISLLALLIGVLLPPYEPFEFSSYAKGTLSAQSECILFNKQQLAEYNGKNGKPLYLAILGSVYDVSKGSKHYGPDCAYNIFVGRDASVSFITGEFENIDADTADDVIGQLQPKDLLGLENWKKFYDKDYIFKGKLIGRFYDEHGMPTNYYYKYQALTEEAERKKAEIDEQKNLYPDCNIQWSEEKGTRVWCTEQSGGKERNWKGYPRKLFVIGSNSFRCACIKEEDLKTSQVMLKEYDNCEVKAHECYYRVD